MKKFEQLKYAHWLVLVTGLCMTLLVWSLVRENSIKSLRQEFDLRVDQISNRIEKRVQEGRTILHATAGLYNASEEVTYDEFRAFIGAHDLAKGYPGIKSISVLWLVNNKDKTKFLTQINKRLPSYRIWPGGERDTYAPTMFLEPVTSENSQVLGFDLLSEKTRREALERARDTGTSAMTDLVRMVGGGADIAKKGFLVVAPIYRNKAPHGTLAERRANIIGWVCEAFLIDEVIPGLLDDQMGKELGKSVGLHIYFGDQTTPESLVYESDHNYLPVGGKRDVLFSATKVVELPGKHFTVVMHSTPDFEKRVHDVRSNAVLLGGIVGTLMLSVLAWMLVTARARAVTIATEMSREMVGREKRYRQMFEDNASIAYILDPADGRIIDANAAAADFWGYSVETLRQMNIAQINLTPFAEIQLGMQQQVDQGSAGQFHFRHRLKSGEVRDVEIFRTVLGHQSYTYIYCIMHDITSRKLAEHALYESQAKLRAIIETALDAVVQVDASGKIIDWNTRAERTFGWTREEVLGKPLVETILPPSQQAVYRSGVSQFVEGDEGAVRHSQFEVDAIHRSGGEFPIEVAVTTMTGNDGVSEYCAFMRDISGRKKTETALRKARVELENRVFERTAELVRANRRLNSEIAERTQAQEALQESQEMLRQLVAHQDRIRENERKRIAREIHDELGQHLLVLRIDVSMLDRAHDEHPKLDERVKAILQHIDMTMKSVRAIINNLRPSVLDLGLYAALEWQAEEFQRRSGIVCELVADDEDLELEDNVSTVLFRIVQEALTNVLRHARASSVRIAVKREPGRLVMTIADNGVGMAQSQKNEQSSSFGLVGIRERLHILGGDLSVDSSSGGTTLIVTLPLAH